MNINPLHRWDLGLEEAKALQRKLAATIRRVPLVNEPRLIAGADVAVSSGGSLRFSHGRASSSGAPTQVFAAVVVWDAATRTVVETKTLAGETRFPYIPGLLSFREAPTLLDAFALLDARPDTIILDGQGIAHPRRFGLACHIGLWLDLPTIGCAKSRLIGTHETPELVRGSETPLIDNDEVVGTVLRTRTSVNPVFVSPGHLIDIADATRLVLAYATRFRLPEPTRLADQLSKRAKRGEPHHV